MSTPPSADPQPPPPPSSEGFLPIVGYAGAVVAVVAGVWFSVGPLSHPGGKIPERPSGFGTPPALSMGQETAPSAGPVMPEGSGSVQVLGDADQVRMRSSRGAFSPGLIPADTYDVWARFGPGSEPVQAGFVTVLAGHEVTLHCQASTSRCER